MKNLKSEIEVSAVETVVYEALRGDITSLRMEPGRRLYVAELEERYGVSATPVRVALQRAERDGLVVTRGRRGTVVAPLALEEFEVIQAHRMGLESVLARRGAVACTSAALRAMEQWLQRVDEAAAREDWGAHLRAQWLLRDACYACANAPHLMSELREQRFRVERYVRSLSADYSAVVEARKYEVELIAACRARDGEVAAASSLAAQWWALTELSPRVAVEPALSAQSQAAAT